MALSKRDQLIDAALRLFQQDGFHATGIDRILAEAGVAKMTLYKHFKSKDELVLAVLRRRDEQFRNHFMRQVEKRSNDPRQRLLAMFDVLGEWIMAEGFCGCTFINACAEFADHDDPAHTLAAEHKRLMAQYIRKLAEEAGVREPARLAEQLCLLMEGAIVMAQVMGDCHAAVTARDAAEPLIDRALERTLQT